MPVGPLPSGLKIRQMQLADLDFAVQLSQTLGWTTTRTDFENTYYYEPEGCFVAELKEEIVGTVTTTAYRRFAWIGMMLVREDLRRRRIGSSLMNHAISYLHAKGITTIRLEADPEGIPLYEHLKFKKECNSERWHRKSSMVQSVTKTRLATKKDLNHFQPLDFQAFGDNRFHVINRLFETAKFVLILPDAPKRGYLMARETSQGIALGPFIADDFRIAEELLRGALERANSFTVTVGVPETHHNSLTLLQKFGFERRSILNRMYHGKPPKWGQPNFEYGIATSATG